MGSMSDEEVTRMLQEMNSTPIIDGVNVPQYTDPTKIEPDESLESAIEGTESYHASSYPSPLLPPLYPPPPVFESRPSQSMPDINFVRQIPIRGNFSLFIEKHKTIASKLIDLLMDCENLQQLLEMSNFINHQINPDLFHYCFEVACTHRKDTKNVKINVFSKFLSKFIPDDLFKEMTSVKSRMSPSTIIAQPAAMLDIIPTGDENDGEARVNYFREDLGVNLHHHHWHTIYVSSNSKHNLMNKDRRGELFYYMHHQMIARYDAERLCNTMPRVEPYSDFRQQNPEGYYSKLIGVNSSKIYPGRPGGMGWTDIQRPEVQLKLSDLSECVSRVLQAIDEGSVITDTKLKLTDDSYIARREDLTIDILGNMIEPSDLSPNKSYYGGLHTYGHIFTAFIHDPNYKHQENIGVMGDFATAVRDPIFFQWHKYIDTFFDRFKASKMCPKYKEELKHKSIIDIKAYVELDSSYKDVLLKKYSIKFLNVTDLMIQKKNELKTFIDYTNVGVAGLDLLQRKKSYVEMKHLNYWPFTYKIIINSVEPQRLKATMRIFLAPKYDHRGYRFELNEQRGLFIEMDRFVVNLYYGINEFPRSSLHSSVTIPFEQTFPDTQTEKKSEYCSCGWPQHMLLPRGSKHGDTYHLFAMASKDIVKISQNVDNCQTASSFCGLNGQKYPDSMDMGFPFDRPFDSEYKFIEDLVNANSFYGQNNMCVQDITIRHMETKKNTNFEYIDYNSMMSEISTACINFSQ